MPEAQQQMDSSQVSPTQEFHVCQEEAQQKQDDFAKNP